MDEVIQTIMNGTSVQLVPDNQSRAKNVLITPNPSLDSFTLQASVEHKRPHRRIVASPRLASSRRATPPTESITSTYPTPVLEPAIPLNGPQPLALYGHQRLGQCVPKMNQVIPCASHTRPYKSHTRQFDWSLGGAKIHDGLAGTGEYMCAQSYPLTPESIRKVLTQTRNEIGRYGVVLMHRPNVNVVNGGSRYMSSIF